MAQLLEYKCPCCSGAISFDSATQNMKCPFCNTEYDVETLKAYDEFLSEDAGDEFNWQVEPGSEWQQGEQENMTVFICESCGGEIIGDAQTAATSCPFCGNPVIIKGQLKGDLKPDYVIPFKLDAKAAKAGFLAHLKGKVLLPKVFKDENRINEIKGVYVPFWLFDTDADANIRYNATRVRAWSDSDYRYTETSHFLVMRAGNIGFDNVPVDGSSKMADDLMESVEPFDFCEAVDFQTAYLSGYFADRYDVDAQQSIARANDRVRSSTETAFAQTVQGYTTVVPSSSSIRLSNGCAKYALYPIWLMNTTWNNQQFTFAMNGQTGKFVGNLPMDKSKFWKMFSLLALGLSAIAVAIVLLFYFGGLA